MQAVEMKLAKMANKWLPARSFDGLALWRNGALTDATMSMPKQRRRPFYSPNKTNVKRRPAGGKVQQKIAAGQFAHIFFMQSLGLISDYKYKGNGAANGNIGERKMETSAGNGLFWLFAILAIFMILPKVDSEGFAGEYEYEYTYTSGNNPLAIDDDITTQSADCGNYQNLVLEIDQELAEQCKICICYPSHFDPRYGVVNGMFRKQPFEVKNVDGSDVTTVCVVDEDVNLKALHEEIGIWHGMCLSPENDDLLKVSTSFSDETFLLGIPPSKIRIYFGNGSELFTKFTDDKQKELHYDPNNDANSRRIPPQNALKSQKMLRESFAPANHGAWLVPLDMAYMTCANCQSPHHSRFFFIKAKCQDSEINGQIKYGKGEPNKPIALELASVNGTTAKPDKGNTPKPDKGNTPKIDHCARMRPAKDLCETMIVSAKAAVIRDRFNYAYSFCNLKRQKECAFHTDYAFRLGCLKCQKSECPTAQRHFLDALSIWLKTQKSEDLKGWTGTDLEQIKRNPDAKQPIHSIGMGQFKYASLPNEWIEGDSDIEVLVHDCAGLGIFVSAARKKQNQNSPKKYEALTDWSNDFVFLEQCIFTHTNILDKTYLVSAYQPRTNYAIRFSGIKLDIGIYLYDETSDSMKLHQITPQQIEAHKFKYMILSDPQRKVPAFGDKVWKIQHEIAYTFGRYFADPALMYEYNATGNNNKWGMDIALKPVNSRDFPPGELNSETVQRASVHGTLRQMFNICGKLYFLSTRMIAIEEVSYQSDKNGEPKVKEFRHATASYEFGGKLYVPKYEAEYWRQINLYLEP